MGRDPFNPNFDDRTRRKPKPTPKKPKPPPAPPQSDLDKLRVTVGILQAAFNVMKADVVQLAAKVETLFRMEASQMQEWDDLKAEVARNSSADQSARILLSNVVARLEELAGREVITPAEIKAEADKLRASTDELVAAVVANTPSEGDTSNAPNTPVGG